MPVTMRDVAERAGVSIRTVSRVVNDSGVTADDTRDRVLAVIDDLGYRPSKLARGLVMQRTEVIGLLIPDMLNHYYFEMARAIINRAEARGYTVLVSNVEEDPKREMRALQVFADYAVDGVILPLSYGNQPSVIRFAEEFGPVVAINPVGLEHPAISHVFMARREGANAAVDHLVQRGCRSIGMILSEVVPETCPRLEGYREALARHALPLEDDWVVRTAPFMDPACDAALRLLRAHGEIDAIFAYNDVLAIGTLRACKTLGCEVPARCAVVGFDDLLISSYVSPALTTVRIDKELMGRLAVDRLLDMIAKPEADYPPIHVESQLVVRESA